MGQMNAGYAEHISVQTHLPSVSPSSSYFKSRSAALRAGSWGTASIRRYVSLREPHLRLCTFASPRRVPSGHGAFSGPAPTGMHICLSEAWAFRARSLFEGGGLRFGCSGGFYGRGFSLFFMRLRLFGCLGFFWVVPEFGAEEVGFFIKREFFHGINFTDLRGVFEGRLRSGEFEAFAGKLQSADFQMELEELREGFEVAFFDGLIHEFDQTGVESGFDDGQSGE